MKTTLHILTIGLLLITFSCGETGSREIKNEGTNQNTSDNSKKNIDPLTSPTDKKLEYIIFGRFCGECGGECATMYKLDILNNKFLVDHTDSYWEYRRGSPMNFATTINDKRKNITVRQIIDSIPNSLLTTTIPMQKFGCPDCTDGCGIYLEIKNDTTIKKFIIDYQTEQLTGEIKIFAEHLKEIIDKL